MIADNEILILLPAYNEATVILSVIEDIRAEGYFDIMVVNDGSTDYTSQLLSEHKVKELRLPINRGVGAAMRLGIYYARAQDYKYLVLIDADGQHYPQDISKLVEIMSDTSADLIIGSRFLDQKSDIPMIRVFYNRLANILTLFGRTKVSDSQSGFRLLNKKAIGCLDLEIDDYGVCTEMIWKSKVNDLKIVEAPIRVRYTEYSMSKGQNLWKGIKTAFSLIKKI